MVPLRKSETNGTGIVWIFQWHCPEFFSKAAIVAKFTRRQSGSRAFALRALWVPHPCASAQYLLFSGAPEAVPALCSLPPWLSLTAGTDRLEVCTEELKLSHLFFILRSPSQLPHRTEPWESWLPTAWPCSLMHLCWLSSLPWPTVHSSPGITSHLNCLHWN